MSSLFAGMESIDYQGKSQLAMGLITTVEEILKAGGATIGDMKTLSKVVKEHTNLSVTFRLVPGNNAYAIPPAISKNNVMFKEVTKNIRNNLDSDKLLFKSNYFSGTVDLKNSKVYGDFTTPFGEIGIGEYFLSKKSSFKPEEVTAIILHEIGHIFVMFEMLSRITKTNYNMLAGLQRLTKCTTQEQRIAVLYELEETTGVEIADKNKIAKNVRTADYYRVVFLSTAAKESVSQLGYNLYDPRAFEQLADQFVSRHGLGKPLAITLDTMWRKGLRREYWSTPAHYGMWVVEALAVIGTLVTAGAMIRVLGGLFVGDLTSLAVLFGFPHMVLGFSTMVISSAYDIVKTNHSRYDPPKRRIEKLKMDAVNALKDRDLPTSAREGILRDIEFFDEIMVNIKDQMPLEDLIWNTIVPFGRKETKEIVFNEQLERMLNNDLYRASAQLKT